MSEEVCLLHAITFTEEWKPTHNFVDRKEFPNRHVGPFRVFDCEEHEASKDNPDWPEGHLYWTVERGCDNCGARWEWETDDGTDVSMFDCPAASPDGASEAKEE